MSAFGSSIGIVAYLALFAGVGVIFLFVNLLVGRFVRPADPHEEKLEIYECGEPTIGSSFVQFDLRFYVVALLFIIFDVEVAFFFPWATVFGKATHMADPGFRVATASVSEGGVELTEHGRLLYQEMGVRNPTPVKNKSASAANRIAHEGAKKLALVTLVDIVVFFAVLLVGFAYVWKRGDLDWVRAVSEERARRLPESPPESVAEEPALSA
ncbi:MAG: NADH-quinone oxidoreductase subunit A [Planctomycetaceae bacterium]|nr:NADH-quinone oxidoreductase subunit A [Planctomycetaceae bacterium]